jgi:enoyl-CoA hydratase/carnithine racemase
LLADLLACATLMAASAMVIMHAGAQMILSLDPAAFREMLATPALAEPLSAVAGCPLVVVQVPDGSAGQLLAGLEIGATPAVVVVVAPDPGCVPASADSGADVFLTEDAGADERFTASAGGPATAIAQLDASVTAHPIAATALALLLRSSVGRSGLASAGASGQVSAGSGPASAGGSGPASAGGSGPASLIAESATYSALQAGAEFLSWRAAHEPRPPESDGSRVEVDQRPGELRITLARPARRNAIDWRMRDALVSALAIAVADDSLRVILRGDGPDFCAGGDLDEFGSRPDPALAHLIRLTRSPALLMQKLASRTTAYLHGSCLGAGIELPAFARTIYAAPDVRIGLPEIGLGLIPGAGGTASLPQRIGRWRTAFLALTGATIGAEQALRWGLIDAVQDEAVASRPARQ